MKGSNTTFNHYCLTLLCVCGGVGGVWGRAGYVQMYL